MITSYPAPVSCGETLRPATPPRAPGAIPNPGSWRYDRNSRSLANVLTAVAISIGLHLALLFGSKLIPSAPAAVKVVEEAPVIRLSIPELKELEPPETLTSDDAPPIDLAVPVPMQSDLPTLPRPSDFVQPLNFASLLEPPDLSKANVSVIPEQYVRAARIADSIGKIFNLEDLDRHPQPVLQPSPTYPHALRREGIAATVLVEFIVDLEGHVREPVVTDSTHPGFNDAAITGVSRWKFRAGWKGGRKVNVRMRVPIVFKVVDADA